MTQQDETFQRGPSPVNPLPPAMIILFLAIMAVEVIFMMGARGWIGGPGAIGWRNNAIQSHGFNSDVMGWMLEHGRYPAEHMLRFLSYPFIHGDFTHALFAGAMALALGKFVGEVFSQAATLALFVISCVGGAIVFGLVAPAQPWLVGAFPGVYGLIGGFTYLMWLKLGQMGAQQYRAFMLIGVLLMIQLVFGLIFGSNSTWIADITGFGMGFLASFILSPGGFARLRAKLRHD